MKVFLTGGTGFIGLRLARSLIARGWEVVALVRRPDDTPAAALSRMGATCVRGDVTDRESMRAGMTGADIVVHNAAWYELGVSRAARKRMRAINVDGTENTLGLALELGIPHTVHVSSIVSFGDSGGEKRDETYVRTAPFATYYEQSKAEAHAIAVGYQDRGLPLAIVCPAHVLGPNDHSPFGYYLRTYLNRWLPPVGYSPEMMMSPAHVEDIAEGIALAAEKGRPAQTYILAGDSMSLRDMFEIWNTCPGAFRVRHFIPRWLAVLLFAPFAPVQRLLGLPAVFAAETISATSVSYDFSGAKAQRELGWTYRPGRQMWLDIIAEETVLLAKGSRRGLFARLRPLELPE